MILKNIGKTDNTVGFQKGGENYNVLVAPEQKADFPKDVAKRLLMDHSDCWSQPGESVDVTDNTIVVCPECGKEFKGSKAKNRCDSHIRAAHKGTLQVEKEPDETPSEAKTKPEPSDSKDKKPDKPKGKPRGVWQV